MGNDTAASLPLLSLLPLSADLSTEGRLMLGGRDVVELAAEFGTPLYVYDVRTIREQCAAFRSAFSAEYPDSSVLYASKAFLSRPFAKLIAEQQLGFDAVSGGEIAVLRSAGVNMADVYFHGSNKTPEELRFAIESGVGRIVIDNPGEVPLVSDAVSAVGRANERGDRQAVLLRISPGVDAHTHEKTTTGVIDTKFGIPTAGGEAEQTIRSIIESSSLEFRGLHMHLGSPIFEMEPYVRGIEIVTRFIAEVCRDRIGVEVQELSPGGGFAVAYESDHDPPSPAEYAHVICGTLRREAGQLGLPLPHLSIEPGRSIVARAGVALYSVGARKEVPGVRTFVSVDGGMADNIRPALYGARYEALSAERPLADPQEVVTIAGKYCESGDVLLRDVEVPRLRTGEVLAIPTAGAYQLSMASNYNLAYRPAVLLVEDGEARLIRRRESADDLMMMDIG